MRFIVEYFTRSGLHQVELDAQSYREVEEKALQQEFGIIGIKCIREIRLVEDKTVHFAPNFLIDSISKAFIVK